VQVYTYVYFVCGVCVCVCVCVCVGCSCAIDLETCEVLGSLSACEEGVLKLRVPVKHR